ncbi:MAG: transcription termination factor NusA [Planctomycetes bacterium]|nr:transcription termination factor NusA [Planctomycetota bacterium]MCP4770595.1 transcription termination factor NusA [Planctomycetota bacterium]MCP4861076.1 transcription termination factor NusA [Planctomycetota bacterium]
MRKDDVLRMIDAIHRERGIEREILFCALEEALSMAVRKKVGVEEGFEVRIDRKDGAIMLQAPDGSISLPSAEELGRIAAQTTKQVFMQKIREAERDRVFVEFEDMVGTVVSAQVHKLEGPNVIVTLTGKTEALLPRSERIQSERLHVGDRIRVLVKEVRKEGSRVVIIMSRKDPLFVQKLFEVEIPEIAEGIIRVMKVARDPGYRSKVAVYSMDERVDCIGACLGVRGTRIRNINDELRMEKIDIIGWSDSLEELVQNALKPAKDIPIEHIFPDEENQSVFVLVSEEQKPLAIGMGGRNVRLAAQIVGWDIELKTPSEYEAEILAEGGNPGGLDQLEVMPEEAAPVPTDSPAEEPARNQEDA